MKDRKQITFYMCISGERDNFLIQAIVISEWERKVLNRSVTCSINRVAQQFPFLDHFTVCSKGAISLPSQYNLGLTVYMGFLISSHPRIHIYAGKFIQENALLGTYPSFVCKIALDVKESRTISNYYVTQTGKKTTWCRKSKWLNIHENKTYLNLSCYSQPFISNPQVEICVPYIFDKQVEIVNNEVKTSQITG